MNISGDAKLIASAFVKARGEMNATVVEDGTGNFGKYATLAAIVKATAAALANNGLAIMQEVGTNEQGIIISTWLVHESGATMQFEPLPMPLTNRTPQAVGSAITYGRRYALAAVCGLAPDDDDGQEAQDAETKQRAAAPAQKAQTARSATNGQNGTQKQETPPQQRLWGQGQSAFGEDWDAARPWIIEKWTGKASPANVRNSSTELSDTEKDMLADYIKVNVAALQGLWRKQKPQPVAA